MSWNTLHPTIRTICEHTLTPPQLRCFILELAGCSTRDIATKLGISRTTARDHLHAAHRKLHHAGIRQHPDGTYIHTTTITETV
jgi:DNA-binding NarL/FixJ family response regulator